MGQDKKPSFLKENRGVILIVLLIIIMLSGILIFLNISKSKSVNFMASEILKRIETTYHDYEKNSEQSLSGIVGILARDKKLGFYFSKRDKDGLYFYSLPIFKELKRKRILTHWYFINPEPYKTCFLRVHNRNLFGDKITRFTFEKCVVTKKTTSGKELGKTAFALRVVHPWYMNNKLLGYLEVGIGIDSFFKNLKKITKSDIALIIRKKFLSRSKWTSVKREKGEINNWNDNPKYLILSRTSTKKNLIDLSDISEIFPENRTLLSKINIAGEHFIKGVFPLRDASGIKIGGIFVLKDITTIQHKMINQTWFIVILSTILMGIITTFMLYFHKSSESKLKNYRNHLEELVDARTKELRTEFEKNEEIQKRELEAVKLAERASKMASVGVITAGITHEINQPLNAIKVSTDSILYWHRENSDKLPNVIISQLKNISLGIERISGIITFMRKFWNIKKSTNNPVSNLNVAVDGGISLFRHQLKIEKIDLSVKKSASPLYIRGDLIHFEQIIINLISNAIKAQSNETGKQKFIKIQTYIKNKNTILSIRDNGPGLPDIGNDELFDPFFSTRTGKDGMGIGLSIIKHFIAMYKGTISASNHENGGAEFTISFPVYGGDK